jgi:hypothetical protein
MGKALMLVALLAFAGCNPPALVENPREIWCRHNTPRTDATPETPRAEVDKINAHNAKGELWCGWKA